MAATALERVSALVLIEPYVPALLAEHLDGDARQVGEEHLDAMRATAEAAVKGQTDRALDLYLELRLGVAWRDRLPKARFGAARRAAANLAPLLTGSLLAPVAVAALGAIELPVTLLVREDAPSLERRTADMLLDHLPRARVDRLPPEAGEPMMAGERWMAAIVAALKAAGK
jgi:pimeloyl-ACP methyl ester carboxylesterase